MSVRRFSGIFHGIKKNLNVSKSIVCIIWLFFFFLLIHHFFYIWFRARSNQLNHKIKMLSNLNHDHGGKKRFEIWKEKIEKKYGRLTKKFPDLIFMQKKGLVIFQPFCVFSVSGNLGAWIRFIPSTSKHRTGPSPTQNDLTLSHMVPSSLMILLGLCHKVKSHYTMNELACWLWVPSFLIIF